MIESLLAQVGKAVELRFEDGYAARVRLLAVDPDEPPNEIIYDLLEVIDWGPLRAEQIHSKAAHAASLADLRSWRVVPPNRSTPADAVNASRRKVRLVRVALVAVLVVVYNLVPGERLSWVWNTVIDLVAIFIGIMILATPWPLEIETDDQARREGAEA